MRKVSVADTSTEKKVWQQSFFNSCLGVHNMTNCLGAYLTDKYLPLIHHAQVMKLECALVLHPLLVIQLW